MSSILEALRKLEEEKIARRGGTGSIAGRVTYSGRRPGRKPSWLIPVVTAAVAVVLTVFITYAVMGGFSARRHGTLPAADRNQPALAPAPTRSLPVESAGPVETTVLPPSTRPATDARRELPSAAPAATPSPSRSAPNAAASGPAPQPAPTEQPPHLTVSGIAWQKDNSARLAVINGVTVAEGGTIEGARVQEILPDRVHFSFNTREFDIYMKK